MINELEEKVNEESRYLKPLEPEKDEMTDPPYESTVQKMSNSTIKAVSTEGIAIKPIVNQGPVP